MIVLEFKVQGKTTQYAAIDEAIRTAQFIRNKAIRFWMDNKGVALTVCGCFDIINKSVEGVK